MLQKIYLASNKRLRPSLKPTLKFLCQKHHLIGLLIVEKFGQLLLLSICLDIKLLDDQQALSSKVSYSSKCEQILWLLT